jgi:Guanylate-binding protein, N-terminal domain
MPPPSLTLIAEEGGVFSLDPQGEAWLMSLGNVEITVASIVGAYRTGKSAILSRLLPKAPGGKSNSFNVGHTVNACTKGIHMSTSLLENPADPNTRILVMDTEGLGAPTAGRVHDTNILVLTLLLSRVLMLNTKGTIDQTSLDTLRVVANIGNVLRASPQAASAGQSKRKKVDAADDLRANEEALGELFPALVWIVRDFALDLEDPNGRKITADQYLENAIQDVAGQDEDKNETRRALRKLFPKRTCITMCRPSADEEVLRNINSQPDSTIDSRFLDQVEALRRTIFMYSKRTSMTGPVLVSLAKKYCEAFNNKRVPVVRDVWDSISREQCQKAVEESMQLFQEHVAKKLAEADTRPKLEVLLSTAFDAAIQKFNDVAVGDNTAAALKELRKQANLASSEHRKTLQDRLTNTAGTTLQKLNIAQIQSIDHLINSVSLLQNDFSGKYGKDPDTVNAWNQELVTRQLVWAREIYDALAQKWEAANQSTRELEAVNSEAQKIREQLHDTSKAYAAAQESLGLLMQTHAECAREMEQLRPAAARVLDVEMQLNSARATLSELKGVEENNIALTEELRTHVVQDEHQRAEITAVKEQLQKATTQVQKLETQRQQQIDEATREMDQLRMHMEAALDEVKESKESAVKRLQSLQADLATVTKKLHDQTTAQTHAEAAHAEQLQRTKQELHTAARQFEQARENLVAKFQQQLETTKIDNANVRQQRENELRLQMQKLESEKAMAERSLQTSSSDLCSIRNALNAKTEEAGSLKSELRNIQLRLTTQDTQLASATTRLEISDTNISKLRQTIETLEHKLATTEEELRQIGQTHEAAMLKQKFRYEADLNRLEDTLSAAGVARPAKRTTATK